MPDLPVSASTVEATTAPSPVPVRLDAPAVTVAQNPYAAAAANAERIAAAFREREARQAGNAVQ
ncbi:hypothetical protein QTQ03_25360 [Micromonospora sp. WMMA1363]|uniref:hypothetical protein n=1 Tax=Micromonospora sp. WMMA1363 TaxID=3053985 RepID=UPI00259C97FC|nr:hypothetical protein [Micromonospora sp. WMMA1363]MDM4722764.1 hypothetical protein [Micromonospora sp. WMMA1363]